MNFQRGCSLVSHDLIDSCKVFTAGLMGKADDGLVEGWKWRGEGGAGCLGSKSSSICFLSTLVHKLFAARFTERPLKGNTELFSSRLLGLFISLPVNMLRLKQH